MLVNSGLVVVVTTHSTFFVDHLNNLMEASKLPDDAKTQIASQLRLGQLDSILSPDQVSTYFFSGQGPPKSILDRSTNVIDLKSFSRASDFVSNLYSAILAAEDKP